MNFWKWESLEVILELDCHMKISLIDIYTQIDSQNYSFIPEFSEVQIYILNYLLKFFTCMFQTWLKSKLSKLDSFFCLFPFSLTNLPVYIAGLNILVNINTINLVAEAKNPEIMTDISFYLIYNLSPNPSFPKYFLNIHPLLAPLLLQGPKLLSSLIRTTKRVS